MSLTDDGREIIGQLEDFMRDLSGIDDMETKLKEALKIKRS